MDATDRQIQDFLTGRRARLDPRECGLPAHDSRRRVPGLKREEVALLAGVSVDYYARLERGRLGGVSSEVLDAIARALKLDQAERQHLFDLAAATGAPVRRGARSDSTGKVPRVRASVSALLSAMTCPAYLRNDRLDIVAANQACLALYAGVLDELPLNLARFVFLDGRSHGFFVEWDEVARSTVASLRTEAGRHPMDRSLTDLIGELIARSDPFSKLWAEHQVQVHATATKRLNNPVVGELELTGDALVLPTDGLTIIAYTAVVGSVSAEKLGLLGSWAEPSVGVDDRAGVTEGR